MKSVYVKLLAAVMILAMFVVPVSAAPAPQASSDVYIIRLEDAPVATYGGEIPGLLATSPAVTGETKLDANSPASLAYRDYLAQKQAQLIEAANQRFGREVEVLFTYDVAYNGLAARLTREEAAELATFPGVVDVQPEFVRYTTTDVSPVWIGADGIWDGSATGGLAGTKGEGVIVGVIDTGLNLDHPSFAETSPPPDSYTHANPLGSGNYLGLCGTEPGTWVCNDKLIGYYIFTGETHEDWDGHGSHTASTAAGNPLPAGYVDLSPYSYSPAISGIAPHANIIGYDGCTDTGGCPGSALLAAINQATTDGVDVINYSIGGGTSDPWNDADSLAFLNAAAAGVVPVTSAGNNGPGAGTIGSPADAPWMVAAGAATHNRAGLNALIDMSGGTTPPPDMEGRGFSGGHGPAPIVYAGDYGDALCLNEFPANTWTNDEIVVCDRGTNARVAKGWNVLQGGAGGFVLANANAGETLNGDVHHLPAVHINSADGVTLKAWLASGSGHTATIEGTTLDFGAANGDVMAGFSSRGPLVNNAPDIIKPDVAAPGVDVLAASRSLPPDAENPTSEYGIMSGTSMASPHTAGSAALLRALYPNWSPAQIKSALMSTAWTSVLKEDGATPADPFDIGAGRVDLSGAGQPGLVLDETIANFQAANPALGGDPKTLNLASMGNSQCQGTCSWTRVVSSTLDTTENWTASTTAAPGLNLTVEPASFALPAYGTQTITVTADTSGLPEGVWTFGEVTLDPASAGVPEAHFPVAVVQEAPAQEPAISITPSSLESFQIPDVVQTQSFTITNDGEGDLDWTIYEEAGASGRAPDLVDWFDDFDAYATGSQVHGQGGWKGWGNDPAAGALTTDTYAVSTPNSVEIVGASDLVHEYTGYDSGLWTYTAWQYVPEDLSGESYFILLNQYDDAGASNNWSAQVHFNGATNLVVADGVGATFPPLPLIKGQWVQLRLFIDLDNDYQMFYYDGQLLYEGSWSDGVSGGGITNIGAVDLFANGASSIYYDNLSLVATCDAPSDIPWASVSPDSGTTPAGLSSGVDVSFDSTGLTPGTYMGNLCVSSNDPETPVLPVPLHMTVQAPANLQVAHLAPFAADPGTAVTVTLNGDAVLTDFAYGDSTEYLPVPPGSYLVEIFPAGSATPAISGTVNLMEDTDYTAIAIGDGMNQPLALLALLDDNSAPPAGFAKLRVGHLAPFAAGDALADVRLQDGTPVLTDVVYSAVATYIPLPAGEYDLKITTPGGDVTLIDPLPVTLNGGDIVSAFATGDGVKQPLGAYALPSGQQGFFLPLAGPQIKVYLPIVVKNFD